MRSDHAIYVASTIKEHLMFEVTVKKGSHLTAMDVKVVVVSKSRTTCQLVVMAFDTQARTWSRVLDSRKDCFFELGCCGLTTSKEIAKAFVTNFTGKDVLLVLHAHSDPKILRIAGFRLAYEEWVN